MKDTKAKEGMRVELISMIDDPNPIKKGTMGTISFIDGLGTIHVTWDNGRKLGLIPGVDKYILHDNMNESNNVSSIKAAIKKTPSNVSKSMPKMPELSSTKTSKQFKSAKIKDVKVEQKNELKGGKADKLTIKDLAKKHNVSIEDIKNEIKIGVKIEKEHVGNDIDKAKEIAMDHVSEFSDYYSNKRYGVLASEKGLKKDKKEKESKTDYMTSTAGGVSTGAYTGNAWGSGPLTKGSVVRRPGPLKETTDTTNTDYTTGSDRVKFADKDGDGWFFDDVPAWEGGEIVDPLAKVKTNWGDSKFLGKEKTLKVEDFFKMVTNKLNESKGTIEEEEELDETTTFASVWGPNGPPVGPAFAAKQGQWTAGKKPIWKGGKIVQRIDNSGVLNPITEANKVKYNPSGKVVQIKKKCTKFPYCNQGDIKALKLSNEVEDPGSYVESNLSEETINNIKEVSKQLGKTFNEVYNIVKKHIK